jgi:UTP--glucose-1-phosphate uridylyltransferase
MKHAPIRKVVIPVAGYGTRFLPFTKAMPKEMLPIIDQPVIQFVVEEAIASGVTDVILVTSSTKRPIEDHFDQNLELEAWLKKQGKDDLLEQIQSLSKMANFIYVRQKGPYGNAIPVLNASHLIGNEPFAVLWGDELFLNPERPRLKQMFEVYEECGGPVFGVMNTDDEGTKKYGIVDPAEEIRDGVYRLRGVVEKPGPEHAPSRLACVGSYVLTPDIFEEIQNLAPGKGGEYYLPDAVRALMKKRDVFACRVEGEYFDTGSKIGWLKANIAMALRRPDLANDVKSMLQSLS